MSQKKGLLLLILCSLVVFLGMNLNFAKGQSNPDPAEALKPLSEAGEPVNTDEAAVDLQKDESQQAAPPVAEAETQWLWGEIVSVDTQKNEVVVKYLDYETDQEKEITIITDGQTTFENKTMSQILPKDTVSIDYKVGSEGKNVAKNISVDKQEITAVPLESPVEETKPADLQPAVIVE